MTGDRMIHQIKYEAVLNKYKQYSKEDREAHLKSQEMKDKLAALPSKDQAFVQGIFARHDTDSSGKIDKWELASCLTEVGFSYASATSVVDEWMPVYDID